MSINALYTLFWSRKRPSTLSSPSRTYLTSLVLKLESSVIRTLKTFFPSYNSVVSISITGGDRSFGATLSCSGLLSGKGGGTIGIDCALAYLPADTAINKSKKAKTTSFNEGRKINHLLYYDRAGYGIL